MASVPKTMTLSKIRPVATADEELQAVLQSFKINK
jgi:hypothetical protein